MRDKTINIIELGIDNLPDKIGMEASRREGKVCIDLYDIAENTGTSLVENILGSCMAIRNSVAPDSGLADIEWTVTRAEIKSAVDFKELENKQPYYMTLSCGHILYCPHTYTSDEFTNKEIYNIDYPIHAWLVIMPEVNNRILYMYCDYSKDEDMILVDPQKFIPAWEEYEQAEFDKRPAEFGVAIQSLKLIRNTDIDVARQHYSDFIDSNTIIIRTETPRFAYNVFEPPYGLIMGFSNGRHRTVNLAALGAPWIPMEIGANTAEALSRIQGKVWL